MTRRIDVSIGRDGRLRTEFSGFGGEDCFEEAEQLRRALASLGVSVEALEVVQKPLAQLEQEVPELRQAKERQAQS